MYKTQEGEPNIAKIVVHSIIGLIVLCLILGSFGIITAGEIGIRTQFGKVIGIVNQGPYFKLPMIQSVKVLDTKTRTINYDKNGNEGDSRDSFSLTEASKNKLEQVKYEAQQTIEKAKADAEAIRIQAQAINSQGGADYVQLQAIKVWKGDVPMYMMSGSVVPFINLK